MTFNFKLNRYEDDGAVTDQALVSIETLSEKGSASGRKGAKIKSDNDAMQALCRATARWIEETEAGKETWDDTSNDLNIADLMGLENDSEFQTFLYNEGILKLSIAIDNTYNALDGFVFDTILPLRDEKFNDE